VAATTSGAVQVVVNVSISAKPRGCGPEQLVLGEHMTALERADYHDKLRRFYEALAWYGSNVMNATSDDALFVVGAGNSHFDIGPALKAATDREIASGKAPHVLSERLLVVGTTKALASRSSKHPFLGRDFSNYCAAPNHPACCVADNPSAAYGTSLAAPYVSAVAYELVHGHGLRTVDVAACLKSAHTIDPTPVAAACGRALECNGTEPKFPTTDGCPDDMTEDPQDSTQCVFWFEGRENWCQRVGADGLVLRYRARVALSRPELVRADHGPALS
jgi:hypothetical protein